MVFGCELKERRMVIPPSRNELGRLIVPLNFASDIITTTISKVCFFGKVSSLINVVFVFVLL